MDTAESLEKTRLCLALTRRGTPCERAPTPGKRRCHYHGGAPGSGAPEGPRNGNWRGGKYSRSRREELARQAQERQERAREWAAKFRPIIGSIPPEWAKRPEWKERIRLAEKRWLARYGENDRKPR
jgi:hypothetical protein